MKRNLKGLLKLAAVNDTVSPYKRYGGIPVFLADSLANISAATRHLPAARRAFHKAKYSMRPWTRKLDTTIGKSLDYALARAQEGIAYGTTWHQQNRDRMAAQGGFWPTVKGLGSSAAASFGSYLQPWVGGLRQTIATNRSDGGKNYTPEPSTEKMFSRDARGELGDALKRSPFGGRYGINSSMSYKNIFDIVTHPSRFEGELPTGSMGRQGDNLVDYADMNLDYQGEDLPYYREADPWSRMLGGVANIAGNLFAAFGGSSDDPNAGKIRTVLPVSKLNPQ